MKRKQLGAALAVYLIGLAGLLAWSSNHGFLEKMHAQKHDRTLLVGADYEDISYFQIKDLPVDVLMVPNRLTVAEEAVFRKRGFTLVWKLWNDLDWEDFSQRFEPGDGLILSGDELIDKPFFPSALAELVRKRNGFVVMTEFSPVKSSRAFYRACPPASLIKGHIIGTRETSIPRAAQWRARVHRAVTERWVRFVCVRFSPAWSVDQNIRFQKTMLSDFLERGWDVKQKPLAGAFFQAFGSSPKVRSLFILGVSVLTPVFLVLLIRTFPLRSPLLAFFLCSTFSVASGVVINALGSTPEMVLGVSLLRGVKLQLVLPLILAIFFLLSSDERRQVMAASVKVKHLVWGGLGLSVLLFVYLSRSGNQPAIAVTESERGFRDAMEMFFGARPRFKEFLFAHPLFILGLYCYSLIGGDPAGTEKNDGPIKAMTAMMKRDGNAFLSDGRLFLWLGLIGQISILNTFTHFYAPLELGLLRSFHGCWLGALIALPFCALFRRIFRA